MYIKQVRKIKHASENPTSITLPGRTGTYNQYVSMARSFFNVLSDFLSRAGISSSYDPETGLGTINGVPIALINTLGYIYVYHAMEDGSFGSSGETRVSIEYSSYSSGGVSMHSQVVDLQLNGTSNAFEILLRTYRWISCARMKSVADGSTYMAWFIQNTNYIHIYKNGQYLEQQVIPQINGSQSGAQISTYTGMALVPLISYNYAFYFPECYFRPGNVFPDKYYTVDGVDVFSSYWCFMKLN